MTSVTQSLGWVTVLTMAASGTMNEQDRGVLNGILNKEDLKTLPALVNEAFMNCSNSENSKMAGEILSRRKEYLYQSSLLHVRQSFKRDESLSREIFSLLSGLKAGQIQHHAGTSKIQTWSKK